MPPPWLMIRGCPAVLAQKFQQSQQLQFSVASALCAKRWKEKSVPAYTSRFRLVKQSKLMLKSIVPGFQIQCERWLVWKPPSLTRLTRCEFLFFHDSVFSFPSNKIWPGMTWNLTSWKLKSTADIFGAAVDLLEQLNHFVMAPVRWNITLKQQS